MTGRKMASVTIPKNNTMVFGQKKKYFRLGIIIAVIASLGFFSWNIMLFFEQLKKEEQKKMEIWAQAYTALMKNDNPEDSFNPILLSIIQKNTSTPMILYAVQDDTYEGRNISKQDSLTQRELQSLTEQFKLQYQPIKVMYHDKLYSIVYYGNSNIITKTKYFPILVALFFVIILLVLYYFYTISKSNEQNKLWAGLAKETAHQIGTPLSSLVGWVELLKTEQVNSDYIEEMGKDIERLNTITDRFSKIGSIPTLKTGDLVSTSSNAFSYLKQRSSKLIQFSLKKPDREIKVRLNQQLLGWTLENLVKNAADAVRGKGEIKMEITEDEKWAYLHLSDTGKGIAKKDFKRIFKPGETSKKRGWGLGLSLAKRIIEDYHEGKIRVLKSEQGKGSTFEVKLKKVKENE